MRFYAFLAFLSVISISSCNSEQDTLAERDGSKKSSSENSSSADGLQLVHAESLSNTESYLNSYHLVDGDILSSIDEDERTFVVGSNEIAEIEYTDSIRSYLERKIYLYGSMVNAAMDKDADGLAELLSRDTQDLVELLKAIMGDHSNARDFSNPWAIDVASSHSVEILESFGPLVSQLLEQGIEVSEFTQQEADIHSGGILKMFNVLESDASDGSDWFELIATEANYLYEQALELEELFENRKAPDNMALFGRLAMFAVWIQVKDEMRDQRGEFPTESFVYDELDFDVEFLEEGHVFNFILEEIDQAQSDDSLSLTRQQNSNKVRKNKKPKPSFSGGEDGGYDDLKTVLRGGGAGYGKLKKTLMKNTSSDDEEGGYDNLKKSLQGRGAGYSNMKKALTATPSKSSDGGRPIGLKNRPKKRGSGPKARRVNYANMKGGTIKKSQGKRVVEMINRSKSGRFSPPETPKKSVEKRKKAKRPQRRVTFAEPENVKKTKPKKNPKQGLVAKRIEFFEGLNSVSTSFSKSNQPHQFSK